MAEAPMPYTPSSPSSPKQSNLPTFFIVGIAAVLLGLYNLLIVRWCNENNHTNDQSTEQISSHVSLDNLNVNLMSSFRYKKEGVEVGGNDHEKNNDDIECSVCLSDFKEGEDVKQLPRCNHSFHASCIDVALFSLGLPYVSFSGGAAGASPE
ncbi:RING-H2 finger protein ATL1-like [Nicotiana tabacum]|uniref:RING-H2 finger protein ATL1-like n=2 Tax=Nicotiana TaxID=4085 RepID=A0A1S4DP94_TOBAC|nr:PREDICTED: RING-H2 finger protein ATL1-like [Nicotiana sylvestris]XP_016515256.1 PREDICTED: RING-H2 finger protein ATL1-like [Nicotiana tabacum]